MDSLFHKSRISGIPVDQQHFLLRSPVIRLEFEVQDAVLRGGLEVLELFYEVSVPVGITVYCLEAHIPVRCSGKTLPG